MCALVYPPSYAGQCAYAIATKTGDIRACAAVGNATPQYYSCVNQIAYLSNDTADCSLLPQINQTSCAFDIAKNTGFSNLSYCIAVPNSSVRSLCDYIYYYQAAITSLRTPYCSMLPNQTNGTLIGQMVTKDYSKGNLSESSVSLNYLYYNKYNITPSGYCYYDLALLTRNQSTCALSSPSLINYCHESFNLNQSVQVQNVTSLCSGFPSYALGLCYYSVYTSEALTYRNLSSCEAIDNKTYSQECIVQLAAKYNDTSYCSSIQNKTVKNICTASVQVNESNLTG